MSKYSLLFEADSYHEIGPFRFPIYHDFTPGESRAFDKLNKSFASGTYVSMQLARRIAQEHKLKPQDALKILGTISAEENQEYLFQYAEDVQKLADGVVGEGEQQARVVTFFMQQRGEVRTPEGDWVRTEDWSEEDTDKVPGKLIREIYTLIMWERNGWPAANSAEGNEQSELQSAPEVRKTQRLTKASST